MASNEGGSGVADEAAGSEVGGGPGDLAGVYSRQAGQDTKLPARRPEGLLRTWYGGEPYGLHNNTRPGIIYRGKKEKFNGKSFRFRVFVDG